MSSIGSVLSSVDSALLTEIDSDLSKTRASGAASSTATSDVTTPDQTDVSQVAKLFREMHELQQQDPDAFKQVMADAATKLRDAAGQSSDPNQTKFLNHLADNFQKAAETGDLSTLRPQGAHPHHHHHGGAAQGTSGGESTRAAAAYQSWQSAMDNQNTPSSLSGTVESIGNGSQLKNLLSAFLSNGI